MTACSQRVFHKNAWQFSKFPDDIIFLHPDNDQLDNEAQNQGANTLKANPFS
jgi:hypothetical protein